MLFKGLKGTGAMRRELSEDANPHWGEKDSLLRFFAFRWMQLPASEAAAGWALFRWGWRLVAAATSLKMEGDFAAGSEVLQGHANPAAAESGLLD